VWRGGGGVCAVIPFAFFPRSLSRLSFFVAQKKGTHPQPNGNRLQRTALAFHFCVFFFFYGSSSASGIRVRYRPGHADVRSPALAPVLPRTAHPSHRGCLQHVIDLRSRRGLGWSAIFTYPPSTPDNGTSDVSGHLRTCRPIELSLYRLLAPSRSSARQPHTE
jgi:hypothetical protein